MYTTLAQAKGALKTSQNSDDAYLTRQCVKVTNRIRAEAQVDLEPVYDTRWFTADPTSVNSGLMLLNLHDYLLEADAIVSDHQNLVWNSDVIPYPRNYTPIQSIRFNDGNASTWRTWYPQGFPFMESIVITGFWGWRRYYAKEAWLPSLQTNLLSLTNSGNQINVTNVNAEDSLFRAPVFSVGNIIRIENEMMHIRSIDPVNNYLFVERGYNAPNINTAVAHSVGLPISIFEIEQDIAECAARQAAFFYARRGSYEEVSVTEVARVQYPRDLLAEIYDTLKKIGFTG